MAVSNILIQVSFLIVVEKKNRTRKSILTFSYVVEEDSAHRVKFPRLKIQNVIAFLLYLQSPENLGKMTDL